MAAMELRLRCSVNPRKSTVKANFVLPDLQPHLSWLEAVRRPSNSRLDRMLANPAGDWTIDDVSALCREYGIRCAPPRAGGSHWKVSHKTQRDILTIPQRRPIKPVYIRKLVRFVRAVMESRHGTP
jgi:hypothetical protein